jgi:formylglycine-generating enzyme required for sulfatase activity
MKATVLTIFALLLIGAGSSVLMTRPGHTAAQVKIEPGKKSKPATPTPTPRKPITDRTALEPLWAKPTRRAAPEIDMVLVPGGDFLMGSPENETGRYSSEGPQHRVTVSSFYIGKCEVTQTQWRAVMGGNPSQFKGNSLPVEGVFWNDAKEFCRRLSQITGEEYRLPTEAEWEYACRAKTTGPYAGNLDAMAWYRKNSGGRTHPVGQKRPNAFGIYDMHGNVWEWCEDDWHKSYENAPIDGSAWVDKPDRGSYRVYRGGNWYYTPALCRSATRFDYSPDSPWGHMGFRLVKTYR